MMKKKLMQQNVCIEYLEEHMNVSKLPSFERRVQYDVRGDGLSHKTTTKNKTGAQNYVVSISKNNARKQDNEHEITTICLCRWRRTVGPSHDNIVSSKLLCRTSSRSTAPNCEHSPRFDTWIW
jgi:hypothetical protein